MTKQRSSDINNSLTLTKIASQPLQQPLSLEAATHLLNGLTTTPPHPDLSPQPHPPPSHRLPLYQKLLPTSTLFILLKLIRLSHRNLPLQRPRLHMVGPTRLLPPPAPHEPPPTRLHPHLPLFPTQPPTPVTPLPRRRLRRRHIRRISRAARIY